MTHKDREPSHVASDPALHLIAAVTVQAARDFHSPDVVTALDALTWFLDEDGAAFWMDAINLPSDPDVILWRLTHGKFSAACKK